MGKVEHDCIYDTAFDQHRNETVTLRKHVTKII